jgi:predicted nucleic acid-binding Zn ribbon protein
VDDQGVDVRVNAERAALGGTLACRQCGRVFAPGRPDKRSCSDRCRAAASRQRQAERVARMEALINELARLAGPLGS